MNIAALAFGVLALVVAQLADFVTRIGERRKARPKLKRSIAATRLPIEHIRRQACGGRACSARGCRPWEGLRLADGVGGLRARASLGRWASRSPHSRRRHRTRRASLPVTRI